MSRHNPAEAMPASRPESQEPADGNQGKKRRLHVVTEQDEQAVAAAQALIQEGIEVAEQQEYQRGPVGLDIDDKAVADIRQSPGKEHYRKIAEQEQNRMLTQDRGGKAAEIDRAADEGRKASMEAYAAKDKERFAEANEQLTLAEGRKALQELHGEDRQKGGEVDDRIAMEAGRKVLKARIDFSKEGERLDDSFLMEARPAFKKVKPSLWHRVKGWFGGK